MLTRRVIEDHQPAEETQHHQHTRDKHRCVKESPISEKLCKFGSWFRFAEPPTYKSARVDISYRSACHRVGIRLLLPASVCRVTYERLLLSLTISYSLPHSGYVWRVVCYFARRHLSPFANLIEASRTVGCSTNRRHCEERINKQLATVSGLLLALPRALRNFFFVIIIMMIMIWVTFRSKSHRPLAKYPYVPSCPSSELEASS